MSTPEKSEEFGPQFPSELRAGEARLLAERRKTLKSALPPSCETKIDQAVGTPEDDRVGVALSGGGIRSATFCLGVFQALSEAKLLRKVDYLSTVSGGGYFGSFLGRLFTRKWIESPTREQMPPGEEDLFDDAPTGVARVEEVLKRRDSWCMRYLRDSGRYLSPNRTGDFWLAIAMFLRNWISMLVVLWTLMFALFAFMTLIRVASWQLWPGSAQSWFLSEVWLAKQANTQLWWSPWLILPLFTIALGVPAAVAYWFTLETWSRGLRLWSWLHRRISRVIPLLSLSILLVLGITGVVEWIPIVILGALLLLAFAVWVWVSHRHGGRLAKYGTRNSLSRILSASLKISLALLAVVFVDALGQSAYALIEHRETLGESRGLVAFITTLAGLGGIAAFGQRLTILLQKLPSGRLVRVPANILAGLAGALLVLLLAGSASFTVHMIAWSGNAPVVIEELANSQTEELVVLPGAALLRPASRESYELTPTKAEEVLGAGWNREPDRRNVIVAFGVSLLVAFMFGQTLGFFNLSSLHAFYSARLARAYLGASNKARFEKEKTPTGIPIEDDDVQWADYKPWKQGGPLHLINQTLNETVGGRTQIEYRDRKGLIMAHGPVGLSVGRDDHGVWAAKGEIKDHLVEVEPLGLKLGTFHALGLYVKDRKASTWVEACTLGRLVAISGAAFTTGIGYRTSIGTSLLAGLLNVRLGYWWTIKLTRREREKVDACTPQQGGRLGRLFGALFPVQSHIVNELTAQFHGPAERRWYLSDGGHFENTGAYELLRRRIPFIIVCDCGKDRDYRFGDLSTLVRQARIDFGAEMKVLNEDELEGLGVHEKVRELLGRPEDFVIPVEQGAKAEKVPRRTSKHALLAQVKYLAPDGSPGQTPPCSYILFLKPSLTGDEPHDVLHYQTRKRDFPNESTLDQYFDEAQWESYRRLGVHVARKLFDDYRSQDLPLEGWQPRDMRAPLEQFRAPNVVVELGRWAAGLFGVAHASGAAKERSRSASGPHRRK